MVYRVAKKKWKKIILIKTKYAKNLRNAKSAILGLFKKLDSFYSHFGHLAPFYSLDIDMPPYSVE